MKPAVADEVRAEGVRSPGFLSSRAEPEASSSSGEGVDRKTRFWSGAGSDSAGLLGFQGAPLQPGRQDLDGIIGTTRVSFKSVHKAPACVSCAPGRAHL